MGNLLGASFNFTPISHFPFFKRCDDSLRPESIQYNFMRKHWYSFDSLASIMCFYCHLVQCLWYFKGHPWQCETKASWRCFNLLLLNDRLIMTEYTVTTERAFSSICIRPNCSPANTFFFKHNFVNLQLTLAAISCNPYRLRVYCLVTFACSDKLSVIRPNTSVH